MAKKKQTGKFDLNDPKTKRYIIISAVLLVILSLGIGIGSVSQTTDLDKAAEQTDNTGKADTAGNDQAEDADVLSVTKEVTINTDYGDIVMEVYPKAMPVTVDNFVKLIEKGFYDGLTFHRVEDWVIQGGDPKGDGTGGADETIKLETNDALQNNRGMVGMARSSDPDSASSQFYILKDDAPSLNGSYAIFGKVIKGMDIVDKIQIGDKMNKVTVK